MPWPTPQDYQEALQNPRVAFADSDLRSGRAEEDRLGLPRPISGAFASVYKVVRGTDVWAVRCFLKEFHDQQQRYAAISARLALARLPFTTGFEFLTEGIRIRGTWYPILKMEWVEGESLIRFVSNNLHAPQNLLSLGSEIVQMQRALQDAGIAHGDLQHGNILVVNGKPKLIDYDGMYVPALKGWGSHEVGHPNYQHPARKEYDFGPGLDNFSVWVIYLSLLALSVRPQLWSQFQGGDDCLLFRRKDFEQPEQSRLLHELERLPDVGMQALAAMFRSVHYLPPLQIPLIDAHATDRPSRGGQTTGMDWLRDHVSVRQTPSTFVPVARPATIEDASWILDSWNASAPDVTVPAFRNSPAPERLGLLLSVLVLYVLIALVAIQLLPAFVLVVGIVAVVLSNLGYWRYRYGRDAGLAEVRVLEKEIHDIQADIQVKHKLVAEAERRMDAELERFAERERELQRQLQNVPVDEQRLIDQANQAFSAQLNRLVRLRDDNRDSEAREIQVLRREVARVVADLDQQMAQLAQAERQEHDTTLKWRQEQHLQQRLHMAFVRSAGIPGIGAKLLDRLIRSGYRTAADINHGIFNVRDIGRRRGGDLLAWRRAVESQARATGPKALPTEEADLIRARYERQLGFLQAQRAKEQRRLLDGEPVIREKWRNELENVNRREAAVRATVQLELAAIRDRVATQRSKLEAEIRGVAEQRNKSPVVTDLSRRIRGTRQRLARLTWQKARLTRQMAVMTMRLTFRSYIRQILGRA